MDPVVFFFSIWFILLPIVTLLDCLRIQQLIRRDPTEKARSIRRAVGQLVVSGLSTVMAIMLGWLEVTQNHVWPSFWILWASSTALTGVIAIWHRTALKRLPDPEPAERGGADDD